MFTLKALGQFSVQPNLFVRVFWINRRLRLVGPDTLVKRLQEGALEQRQSPLHLSAAQPQGLLTLRHVPEAQRGQLLHLHTDTQQGGKLQLNMHILYMCVSTDDDERWKKYSHLVHN